MSEAPTPEQARAAIEWAAQEAADHRRTDEQVAAFNGTPAPGSVAPAAPVLTPEQQAAQQQAQQVAQLASVLLPKLGLVLVAVADRLVQQYAGPQYALTEPEKLQIAEATGPVIQKYLPEDLTGFLTTPEGVLVATVAVVYGAKFITANPEVLEQKPATPSMPQSQPEAAPAQPGASA